MCFLLGNSPASEFYKPTFRNTLFHLHRWVGMKNDWGWEMLGYLEGKTFTTSVILHTHLPMKMEQTGCSETSAYTAYEDGTDRVFRNVGLRRLWRWNRQGVPKRRLTPLMKMEQTGCSETSAYTAYEDETDRVFRNVGLHRLWRWNRQGVSKRRLTPPMKMEQTGCSEMSAYRILTPGNYSEESIEQGINYRKTELYVYFIPLKCFYSVWQSSGQ